MPTAQLGADRPHEEGRLRRGAPQSTATAAQRGATQTPSAAAPQQRQLLPTASPT